MSIGGPCLWVPMLSSPVTSPLAAVTSQLSPAARHGERVSPAASRTISPLLALSRERESGAPPFQSAEMYRTGGKAENALSTSASHSEAVSSLHPEREMSSPETKAQSPGTPRDHLLSRVKLEIPGGNGGSVSMSRPQDGAGHLEEDTDGSHMNYDDGKDDHDKESSISPSDEKDESMGGDESHRSPTLDKKKMKRFRLTHNQTRFLMSEFTRQAHPDAAHRERLSREIPGLTPRQVQVWFQNRRAKLKRLTTNDRERMLKSRALPDDFDTTRVLRTPFESHSTGQTPVPSPSSFGAPNPDFAALRALRTDFLHRPTDDDYLVSPQSSASTTGTYMSSAGQGRTDGLPQSNLMFIRPDASASMSDLHRTIRSDYPVTRSSSLSEASSQPPNFHSGMQLHNRFAGHPNQHGIPYMRQPNGVVTGYDQHRSFEGSVSPTDSQGGQMTYDMSSLGSQPPGYQSQLALHTQLPPHGRPLSTMQEYRPYSYGSPTGSMGPIPYTQANNASTMSLPTSFAPSEQGTTAPEQMQQRAQPLDSMRSKFNIPSYSYANYIQQ